MYLQLKLEVISVLGVTDARKGLAKAKKGRWVGEEKGTNGGSSKRVRGSNGGLERFLASRPVDYDIVNQ